MQIVSKWVENFVQNKINAKYIDNDFKIFAIEVEFRQIWSHWIHITIQIY